jgi:hypothetical protein
MFPRLASQDIAYYGGAYSKHISEFSIVLAQIDMTNPGDPQASLSVSFCESTSVCLFYLLRDATRRSIIIAKRLCSSAWIERLVACGVAPGQKPSRRSQVRVLSRLAYLLLNGHSSNCGRFLCYEC